jgi:hypothetical protein
MDKVHLNPRLLVDSGEQGFLFLWYSNTATADLGVLWVFTFMMLEVYSDKIVGEYRGV